MRDRNGKLIKARDTVQIKVGLLRRTIKYKVVMTYKHGLLPMNREQYLSYLLDGILPKNAAEWGKGRGLLGKPPHLFEII